MIWEVGDDVVGWRLKLPAGGEAGWRLKGIAGRAPRSQEDQPRLPSRRRSKDDVQHVLTFTKKSAETSVGKRGRRLGVQDISAFVAPLS
jgi:hypothetical protein